MRMEFLAKGKKKHLVLVIVSCHLSLIFLLFIITATPFAVLFACNKITKWAKRYGANHDRCMSR